MEVGERIRRRREELKMTQDELAQKVGYTSRSSVAKVEANANGMVQSKLILFAEALQTTPAYLLGWTEASATEYQKADTISDIIIKLRSDDELLEIVKDVCNLSDEQRVVVKTLLSAFNKDSE